MIDSPIRIPMRVGEILFRFAIRQQTIEQNRIHNPSEANLAVDFDDRDRKPVRFRKFRIRIDINHLNREISLARGLLKHVDGGVAAAALFARINRDVNNWPFGSTANPSREQ